MTLLSQQPTRKRLASNPPPDADTNAAIVCGLLGALHGASAIPAELRQKVEAFEARPGNDWPARPESLWGRRLAPLAEQLYNESVQDAEGAAAS